MIEQEAVTEQGSVSPTENLDRWLADKTEALRADAEPEAQPAAEPVVEETPDEEVKTSWRDARLDDVDHGFLKGRTAGELYESYRHSELAKQTAERERAELRRQLDQIQQAQVQREAIPNPENDPRIAKYNELYLVDPTAAVQVLRESWREDAREVARHEMHQQAQSQAWNNTLQTATQASYQAMTALAERYGLSEEEAAMKLKATWPTLKEAEQQYGNGVWLNPNNYLQVAERLYGKPHAQAEVSVPAPEIPNPPGSRRPALAEAVGIDADRFVARAKGATRG
jgi:hypothetical protein